MNYQVLARKWRPKNFSEMVGQEHVLRALTNALDNDRLHHAFLFTGTRGVGKTTIGRILAKSLNCEEGISSKPCGVCSACQEIDEGRFIDLIEVDAASRTKVEDTRELLENVQYAPTRGRFKVYLIDEVHMLSNHSFNALLKTLEEPPEHVKFLLATTDPQKLPVTILSRCLQFSLKRLSEKMIAEHMQFVLGEENISNEPGAIQAIANAADGSMRDALSLLDQAIAHGGGKVETSEVHDMLGTIEGHHVENLLRAIISGDAAVVINEMELLAEKAPDFNSILADLISLLHQLAIAQMVPDAIDDNQGNRETILALSGLLPAEDVQLYYQIALIGKRDLPLAPDLKSGLEMVLLRMLAFKPYEVTGQVARAPVAASQTASAVNATATKDSVTAEQSSQGQVATPVNNTGSEWEQIIQALGLKAMTRELAVHCVLDVKTDDQITLLLDSKYEQIRTPSASQRLEQALSAHFSKPIKLEIKLGIAASETPAQAQERVKTERQDSATDSIRNDPFVKDLQDVFDADLDAAVIRPTD